MALRRPRCTYEFNTKVNLLVSFGHFCHVKDFDVARDHAAEGLKKSPDGHTMGKNALTNGPMSSRFMPNLKISIIVCPSCVIVG